MKKITIIRTLNKLENKLSKYDKDDVIVIVASMLFIAVFSWFVWL